MSYDIIAKSTDSARPIELYQIAYSGRRWYYTSADRELAVDGLTYTPIAVEHDSISQASDIFANGLSIRFDRSAGFAPLFNPVPPSEVVMLTILSTNYLVDSEFVVFWKGKVINAEWKGSWIELTSQSNYSSMQQQGLRRSYSRNCDYVLYGPKCRVNADAHRDRTTVVVIDGLNVVIASAVGRPDNYYAGGFMTWTNVAEGNIEKRMIRSSEGATGRLYLSSFPIGMAAGIECDAYAGCAHTLEACDTKFNNTDNYGGSPYIPTKNPFKGSMLY